MLGFAWLAIRQAQEALRTGRLEEAYRLLCQPAAQGHKRSGQLLKQVARAFVSRAERHLQQNDKAAAWNDLVAAEQVGVTDQAIARFRQQLTQLGLKEVHELVETGEPGRAAEAIAQLRHRSVGLSELRALEEAARSWMLAREQADRGEFALALQAVGRVVRALPEQPPALRQFLTELEYRQRTFATAQVQLHAALDRKDWHEVMQLAEQALSLAPQHIEARKARALAWRVIEPETVAQASRRSELPRPETPDAEQRFLLWIDGVGGYLVCLGSRVTLGQATQDAYVDVPLFADVSRIHAALNRDSDGYVLEAVRPLRVNGQASERALLQSGDRVTLGSSCQIQFLQPVPVSTSARLDLVSGHRLALPVDGVLLMADTLILGPGAQAHVQVPDLKEPVVLYRQKEGLGVRFGGNLCIDGQRCNERGTLGSASTVSGDDFAFAIEPVGTGIGRM